MTRGFKIALYFHIKEVSSNWDDGIHSPSFISNKTLTSPLNRLQYAEKNCAHTDLNLNRFYRRSPEEETCPCFMHTYVHIRTKLLLL